MNAGDRVSADEVIEFWFAEENKKRWFKSSTEFDDRIRQNFEDLWRAASRGELQHWRQTPLRALALVIVLDQFPLNMYRGKPESYLTEAASRDVARYALARGFEHEFDNEQKLFLFLPFMHSEDPDDQETSVRLFSDAGMEARWARHHRQIIQRFGRFPHRNAILGRQSSEEELQWLNSDKGFKG